jgi:transposase InsO family protein
MAHGKEALERHLFQKWGREYNEVRPHSSLGYQNHAPAKWITNDVPKEQQILAERVDHEVGAGDKH